MRELFDITPHNNGGGFTMNLRTGAIDIPDEQGCYVPSTGCGSGKTECCKSIIRHFFNEGITYCTASKDDLKEMYKWIDDNSVNIGINMSDVIILQDVDEQFEVYKEHPEILLTKKVILLTHYRFWTDMLNYFMIYRPQCDVGQFDGNFQALMSRPDLRKYILFDETPTFVEPFVTFKKITIGCLAGGFPNPPMNFISSQYHNFVENEKCPYNPFRYKNRKIDRMKQNVALSLLPKYLPQWISSDAETESITFTPSDLGQRIVNTHVIIFEGVGEVLFQNSNVFQVLDCTEKKYVSPVHFEPLEFNVNRYKASEQDKNDILNKLYALLSENQEKARKMLVVVWKDANGEGGTTFVDWIKSELMQRTGLNPDYYDVTYFGAANSKGSNKFRDFDDIALIGKWEIPNTETAKFNKHFGCDITSVHQTFWSFVQLILRIGIRTYNPNRHFGIYHTTDYNPYFMKLLEQYLTDSRTPLVFCTKHEVTNWLEAKMSNVNIHGSQVDHIKLLFDTYPTLENIVRTGNPGNIQIPLNELYNLIPKSMKKRREYNSLITNLEKLGVFLYITRD